MVSNLLRGKISLFKHNLINVSICYLNDDRKNVERKGDTGDHKERRLFSRYLFAKTSWN